jgi:DNA-binding GntR family transcriptional regulator
MILDNNLNLTLRRQSLANEIAKKLSELIQDGSLPPGTRLLEVELANQLGVSRGPLREALRILEADALVETIPGRGSYVAPVSRVDAEEVYSIRILLETEAVRLACKVSSPESLTTLEQVLEKLLTAAKNNDVNMAAQLDMLFHQTIWEMTNHKRLKMILMGMIPQVKRYLSLQTHLYDNLFDGIQDHQDIYQAISDRDSRKAEEAMRKHLYDAAESARQHLTIE